MNEQTIDLTHSLESCNDSNENGFLERPIQEAVIKTFEKFSVNFDDIKKEIKILDFVVLESQEKDEGSIFAEFNSVSYKITFVTYNLKFLIRLLTFQNENKHQILKLDIQPEMAEIKKEIEYCCNSLQRRRNLNLMIKTLITCARFIESRRLICDLILKKNRNVKIEQNKDGGIIIVYSDEVRNVKLGIFWSISCSSTHEITDIVEVYYKVLELPNKDDIVNKLTMLTDPSLNFTNKYHLWKSLINDVSEKTLFIKLDKMPSSSLGDATTPVSQTYRKTRSISDKSLVVVIDKMLTPSSLKEKEADGVTILSSDTEDYYPEGLNGMKNLSKQDQTSTVIVHTSTSEESKEEKAEEVICTSSLNDQPIISIDEKESKSESSAITVATSNMDNKKSNDQTSIMAIDTLNTEEKENTNEISTRAVNALNIDDKKGKDQTSMVITDTLNLDEKKNKDQTSTVTADTLSNQTTTLKSSNTENKEKLVRDNLEGQNISCQALSLQRFKAPENSATDSSDSEISSQPKTRKTRLQLFKDKKDKPVPKDIQHSKKPLEKSPKVTKKAKNKSDASTVKGAEASETIIASSNSSANINIDSSDSESKSDEINFNNNRKSDNRMEYNISESSDDDFVPEEIRRAEIKRKRSISLLNTPRRSSSRLSSGKQNAALLSTPCINISESSDDDFVPEVIRRAEIKRKRSISLLNTPRRSSSRLSSGKQNAALLSTPCSTSQIRAIYNTPGRNSFASPESRPSLRSCQNKILEPNYSPKPTPIGASTNSPNSGIILISDIPNSSALLSSIMPNNLINTITPKKAVADSSTLCTTPRNMRIRLVPDVPVTSSPRFVELNLVDTPKKRKIHDDDLEITSVAYVVPD